MVNLNVKQFFHQNFGLKILKSSVFIVLLIYVLKLVSCTKIQFDSIHRTKEAIVPREDLYCYSCDYLEQGEICENVNKTTSHNNFTKKCQAEESMCMVKKFSYTTSTENSTSEKKLWSLQRNCTDRCDAGCIQIGERTKLYACTYCCNSSLCNTISATNRMFKENRVVLIKLSLVVFILPNFYRIF